MPLWTEAITIPFVDLLNIGLTSKHLEWLWIYERYGQWQVCFGAMRTSDSVMIATVIGDQFLIDGLTPLTEATI